MRLTFANVFDGGLNSGARILTGKLLHNSVDCTVLERRESRAAAELSNILYLCESRAEPTIQYIIIYTLFVDINC